MSHCFNACGCGEYDGISKADLDRYTDKIENCLREENGRKIFRHFLITGKFKDAKKCLDFWEKCDETITSSVATSDNPTDKQLSKFLGMVDDVIDGADRIDELDYDIVEKLSIVRDSNDKANIVDTLKLLQNKVTNTMHTEFNLFKEHFSRR